MSFTQEQQAVINHGEGHALVRAVAGAGKTHTMVARVVRLISRGIDPAAILIIQFNKTAQLGFEKRLKQALGNTPCPPVRTFNAIGFAMLKRLNDTGAIPPRNLTQSTVLSRRALSNEWRKAKGGDQWPTKQDQADFHSFIGLVKSTIDPAQDVFAAYNYAAEFRPFIPAFYEFESLRKAARQHSFDDQIWDPVTYLENNPEQWRLFSDRYQVIIVDEAQDANSVNFRLLQGLAGKRAELCLIGDPSQAIYGFRGCSPKFLLSEFQKCYPNTTVYPMSRNFRYGGQTSLMANHLIRHNRHGDTITIPMESNYDTQVTFLQRKKPTESGLVQYLKPFHEAGQLSQCTMLVRFYSSSIIHEIELMDAGVPFHCYGREPLLHVPEIACLYAALCLATNQWPDDEPVMIQKFVDAMLTFPHIYIPEAMHGDLVHGIAEQCQKDQADAAGLIRLFVDAKLRDNPSIAKNLRERAEVIDIMATGAFYSRPPADVIGAWIALTKLDQRIQNSADRQLAQERMANINAFRQMAAGYKTVSEMLDTLGPMAAEVATKPPQTDHLKIQTIHSSKGLEFPHVILPGWNQNAFPRQGDDEEEERRLAYVAITRATHELVFLTNVDIAFDAHCVNLGTDERTHSERITSPFLFQAEPGLSIKLAKAIKARKASDKMPWFVRDASLVRRYVKALDLEQDFTFHETPQSKILRDTKPLPDNIRLTKGDQVWHRDHGACTIVAYLYDPVYRVKPNSQQPEQMLVISERQGWRLLHKVKA